MEDTETQTIGTAEIARMLNVSREHVTDRLIKLPTFPSPVVNVTRRIRYWRRADVEAWAAKRQKTAA